LLRTKLGKTSYVDWLSYVALAAITIVEILLNFGRTYTDSLEYLELAGRGVSSRSGPVGFSVNMRFLLPFLAKLLSEAFPFLGLVLSFAILNCLFWIGGVIVAYVIGLKLCDKATAFLSGLFYTTSVAMLAYGAAVLTDAAGYFFVGLSLCLVLRTTLIHKSRLVIESAVLTLGGFFHPSAFLGLVLYLFAGFKNRRKVVWVVVGIGLTLVAIDVFTHGTLRGYLNIAESFFIFSMQHTQRPGPDLLDALAWTFGVAAPIQGVFEYRVNITLSVFGPSSSFAASLFWFLWLVFFAVVGFWKTPRHRKLLIVYLFILSLFPFAAYYFIERYLFAMWPFFVPILVIGILNVARVPAVAVRIVLRKLKISNAGPFTNPVLYATIYLLLQGLSNTILILAALGPSPFTRL
jgi:4-amino-4-deoxy-L-arabinose transferase-like glycosyltransferase